jgi:hypothetical protein
MAIGDVRDDGYMKPAADGVATAARRWRLENGCGDGVARLGHGATPFTENGLWGDRERSRSSGFRVWQARNGNSDGSEYAGFVVLFTSSNFGVERPV